MDITKLKGLIARYIGERLQEWEDATYSDTGAEALKNGGDWQDSLSLFSQATVDDCVDALRSNDVTAIAPIVDEFVQRYGLDVAKDSPQYRTLARDLLKAEGTIAKETKQRAQGEYTDFDGTIGKALEAIQGAAPSVGAATAAAVPASETGMLLSEAVAAYLNHFSKRAPKTIVSKKIVFKRFIEILGDRRVRSITKQDGILYRDTLAQLPSHMPRQFPGLSIQEVLKKTKGKTGIERISQQTVNMDLTHLNHLFAYLIDEGEYPGPQTPVRRLSYTGLETNHFDAFTDGDLKTILTSDELARQRRGQGLRRRDKQGAGKYWVFMILLYTGARRNEIADLAVNDIRHEDGCDYFDITPDLERGRRLKTKPSKRRVPIHSHLVEAGLLRYVEEQRQKGETRLFGTPVRNSIGPWFARLLVSLKIKATGNKSLHSLRSTVENKLYAAGVDGETRRALIGHEGKDVHERVYLRPPLKTLKEHLEKLDFRPMMRG
jgi:integrase